MDKTNPALQPKQVELNRIAMSSPNDVSDPRKPKRRRNHQAAGSFPPSAIPMEITATATPAAQPALADALLLNLANACRKHQKENHSNNSNSKNHKSNKEGEAAEQGYANRSHCQDALASLQKILPTVEENYKAVKQPSLENIKHFCDFYDNVCRGGFCPSAPILFRNGRDGTCMHAC
jgi:hypothetical protein